MPNPNAQRGEVWIIDLGYLAKTRPCLILSVSTEPHERTSVSYVPATTSASATRFEVSIKARFLSRDSVFDAQQIGTHPKAKLIRKIGSLTNDQLLLVEAAVKEWLGLV